ncbi:MAG: glycosyltransferase, partial [Candidatus Eisenbacteria bacterium]|nr:glycosyltransferase [Candidatus Eisenbacteria bacterium]
MHIVIIHRGMFPERIGGTYTYIYELGRGLAARGHEVDVIASTQKPDASPPYDLEGMKVHTYTYRRVNPIYSTMQHLAKSSEIFHSIHERSPVDILSVHDSHLGLRAAKSALGRSVCQIPTYHAPVFLEFRFNTAWKVESESSPLRKAALRLTEPPLEYWQRRFEKGVLELADGVLVLSRFSKGLIEEFFPTVDTGKVRIIQGGVDADRFAPADDRAEVRRGLGLGDHVYLVTVRNLMPRMGLEQLVDAMSTVAKARSDARLVVCGAGPLRDSLERRISEHGLEDMVTLAGRVTDDDLVRY